MRDGIQLAADVWVPRDLEAGEKLPAILITTRYWRAHAMGPVYRLMVGVGEARVPKIPTSRTGGTKPATRWSWWMLAGVARRPAERPVEWSDAEVADMGEITEWITSQPWSNGAVGAVGVSYSGNTAELSTMPAHPALRAVAPLYSDFDPQFFLTMPGGVYNRAFVEAWNGANQALDANDICALEDVGGSGVLVAQALGARGEARECRHRRGASSASGCRPRDARPRECSGDHVVSRRHVARWHEHRRHQPLQPARSHRGRERADADSRGLARCSDRRRGSEPIHDQRHGAGARDRRVEPWWRGRRGPLSSRTGPSPDPTFDQQFADLVAFFDRHLDEASSVARPSQSGTTR